MTKAHRHVDDARRRVWIAFADHFLDTETRQDLPKAALAAVEGGFSVEESRDIWRYEVTPVVAPCPFDVAPEWVCWPEDWLISKCAAARVRRVWSPIWLRDLLYRLEMHFDESWAAIERCMKVLYAVDPALRRALSADLCALAEHYFNFCPANLGTVDPDRRRALRRTYEEVFLPIFRPALVGAADESPKIAAARVEKALGRGDRPPH